MLMRIDIWSRSQRRMKSVAVRYHHYHQFAKQDEPYKSYVAMMDADVDNRLREERHDELQHASEQQTEKYPEEVATIATEVACEKPERTAFAFASGFFGLTEFGSFLKNIATPLA